MVGERIREREGVCIELVVLNWYLRSLGDLILIKTFLTNFVASLKF